MPTRSHRLFRATGLTACLVFAALLSIRVFDLDRCLPFPRPASPPAGNLLPARETWMNVLQDGRKIGHSHFELTPTGRGYRLSETMFMRINTMGVVQNLAVRTDADLMPDLSLADFDFEIRSGVFQFSARGTVAEGMLMVDIRGTGDPRQVAIPLDHSVYLAAGVLEAAIAGGLAPGAAYALPIFDPATLGQETITLRVVGREEINLAAGPVRAVKVLLFFKGAEQAAWIDEAGDVVKESGLLGISLEKTTRAEALGSFPQGASRDLTQAASIDAGETIREPAALTGLTLRVTGIPHDGLQLHGGRQVLEGDVLSITLEAMETAAARQSPGTLPPDLQEFLAASPFIQADDRKITALAETIVSPEDPPFRKARKLVRWVYEHIDKQPVISLPDAVSTLERGTGDCNEHAVLLAALARAAGVPAKVEAGLVYQQGRFYYHAWNLLFVGKWVTADATLDQLPADVTHIRFVSGAQKLQLDLMSIIGRVGLTILALEEGG